VPAALLPLLLLTCEQSGQADVQAPWPGLPGLAVPAGWGSSGFLGTWGDGLSEVARARQWVKIPAQAVAAAELREPNIDYPVDDPQGRYFTQVTDAAVYLSSPKGAKHGYGVGLPVTVHTVAFGAIPIQAGVQLEQLRDADDLPVPLSFRARGTTYRTPQQVRPGVTSTQESDATLTGKVRVRLTALSVDGVDVGLGDCLSAPIDLDLKGNPAWVGDPLTDPATHDITESSTEWSTWFAARGIATINGGALPGQIDIPPFSHCLTKTGEDLSPLLTSAVSGRANQVTVGLSAIGLPTGHVCGTLIPGTPIVGARGPFLGDPSDCDPGYAPPTLDYPARKH